MDTGIYLFQNDANISKYELKTITQQTMVKFSINKSLFQELKKLELEILKDKSIATNISHLPPAKHYIPGIEEKHSITMIKSSDVFLLTEYVHSINALTKALIRAQNITFRFSDKKNRFTPSHTNITSFLDHYFSNLSSFISQPVFNVSPQKVVINLGYFFDGPEGQKTTILKKYNHKSLNLLCAHLSKQFKKEVVLDLVRLYKPYLDSRILAQIFGEISNTSRIPYFYLMDLVLKRNIVKNPAKSRSPIKPSFFSDPSHITGINIRLAGRLLSQPVIPKVTVKTGQSGSLSRANADVVFKSRSVHKNKRGTYSYTISIGHAFF